MKLGLDLGSLTVKAVMTNDAGGTASFYRFHKGEPERTLLSIAKILGEGPLSIAVTGSGARRIADRLGITCVDPAVALIAGLDDGSGIRHIIDIGGGSLSIVDLDEHGRFAGFRTNSLCAAGTGSFLDEQAARMGLSLEETGRPRDIDEPPRIAARCAVFAKSDLIHRQQEGFTIPQMWSGLCRGMVTTAMGTLFRGRRPSGPVLLAGGVAKNMEVVRWLKKELAVDLMIPSEPETFSARGALKTANSEPKRFHWDLLTNHKNSFDTPRRPKLELTLSGYPSFECKRGHADDGTEVRANGDISGDVVIGIDVGSTSTKAAIVDLQGNVVADLYRRTSGDPIGATQRILASISRAATGVLNVRGVGTTGSGRKMLGAIIGADRIINEITAHATGAAHSDPDVTTIFEIGGQDSKFISLVEGVPHDSNMNYVCAAGTGSFVEEQANKLGFALTEIGDSVMMTEPPFSTDRCTVFMEQDVHALIRQGFERSEVMGSVLYSVVQNYLNKVVGTRPYSKKKICFMGATARNKGLVAAFEKILGSPIAVSPYCHVMGAFGVALIVLGEVAKKNLPTTFRGLSFSKADIRLKRSECKLCQNRCRITHAVVESDRDADAPSWGYMCGKDPSENRMRVSHHFDAFRERERLVRHAGSVANLGANAPKVGMPRALLTYSFVPMWRRFMGELGMKLVLSSPSNETTLARSTDLVGSDYCYPVKLAHGHIHELAEDPDIEFIFLPYLVQAEPHDDDFKRSVFCPYNIAFPSIANECGALNGKPAAAPVINFQLDTKDLVEELHRAVSPHRNVSRERIWAAWKTALDAQQEFAERSEEIGRDAIARLEKSGEKGVVILGRPYNVYDLGSNLNLPQKVADLDLVALSVDMLPIRDVAIDPLFANMYWRYGRKILQAATFIAKHPNLHAVYLTNFGCGPDSFLQTYVERIMRGKPMLMLELDEHSADAGYITRLEAFRDVIGRTGKITPHAPCIARKANIRTTLWIPPMHPYSSPLLAAAVRSTGRSAQALPLETKETFELAKRYCRGTECVPAPSTIGAFLSVLRSSADPSRESFFMPVANGPCRFGQYNTLHRIILDEAGFRDTHVESWGGESFSYGTDAGTSRILYNAIVAGDILYKARCRIRPYAKDRDAFDHLMKETLSEAERVSESGGDWTRFFKRTAAALSRVARTSAKRPLIGIVGEIYVRLNPFTNGNLVETIEDAGGEAWVAPLSEWFHYLAVLEKMREKEEKSPCGVRLKSTIKKAYMMKRENDLTNKMRVVIGDRTEPHIGSTLRAGETVFPRQFDGESILTVGRAIEFAKNGADLVVNCSPFGCMPGTLTSGIFQRLEAKMGVPVVSLFFDGETDLKPLVRTYLSNVRMRKRDEAGSKKSGDR